MTLSIIIPTYNEEQLLPYLLETLQAQNYQDFEVIVADNHSTDKTREIAHKFGARVIDGGLPGAGRNLGAAVAKGRIFLFLDADVILPAADFLEKALEEIYAKNLGVATCYLLPMSEKIVDKILHQAFNKYMQLTAEVYPHAPGFCLFASREVFQQVNGFDEKIKLAEDHYFTREAQKFCKYGILTSYKIPVSVRRLDRDGRTKLTTKYILCEMYMWTRGAVKSDIFKYKFGYDK